MSRLCIGIPFAVLWVRGPDRAADARARSPISPLRKFRTTTRAWAPLATTVCSGAAGPGKTLVAKATHDLSGRWPVRLAANVRILATASPTTTGRVMSESWENLVKRWVVLGDDAVRNELASRTQVRDAGGWVKDRPTQGVGLREIGRRAAQAAEQTALRDALARVGGNRAAAARLLQVSYRTLLQKLSADEHGSRSGARSRTAAGDAGPQPGDGALA